MDCFIEGGALNIGNMKVENGDTAWNISKKERGKGGNKNGGAEKIIWRSMNYNACLYSQYLGG